MALPCVKVELPVKKKRYIQKYRTQWESEEGFKGWLQPVSGDVSKAMCILCEIDFNAKIYDIRKHAETRRHRRKIEEKSDDVPLPCRKAKIKTKRKHAHQVTCTLSLSIAEHSLILSVDHLTETYKIFFKDSPAAVDLKLHRTKCTEIINYVLAPYFQNLLLQDVGEQKFSIIIDKSTDVCVSKYLGIVIQYFSQKYNNIITSFLALVKLEAVDARGIVDSLVACLQDYNLPLENMIGFGADNASVMPEVNDGVYAILKREYNLENLVFIKCMSHSIQLAVSHASENTLPHNIEFFVREIHRWFSISPKRMEEYKEIYELIKCGEEPLKLLKVCDIRWLSMEPAVVNILNEWDELKLHFNLVKSKENCYTAELISSMLNDNTTRYYLMFLRNVLSDVQTAIKCFEGENANPLKLSNTLITLIRSICSRILTPSAQNLKNYLEDPITEGDVKPDAYLGHEFETAFLQEDTKCSLKLRCSDFLIKLVHQLQQQLPNNYQQLEKMALLSPEVVKKSDKDISISELARALGYPDDKVDKIVQQWNVIHLRKWDSTDVIQFWVEVKNYKNASGENTYQDLCDLALTALSLPNPNAEVDKLFSSMSLIKNKNRNKIDLLTLNSILTIRYFLNKSKEANATYSLPQNIVQEISKSKKPKFDNDSFETNEPLTSAIIVDLDGDNIIL